MAISSGAPWWGVPVIAGVFLLFGAVLGFLFNRLNEKLRVKRDNETRWHQDIRVLLAELIAASNTLLETESEIRNNTRLGLVLDPAGTLRIHNALIESLGKLKFKAAELLLIASKSLHKKAMQYTNLVLVSKLMIANGGVIEEVEDDIMKSQIAMIDAFRLEMLIEPNKKRPWGR